MAYEYTTHTVPMADTGIRQSLGFESDAAFLEHQRAEEAKLDPEVQAALTEMRADIRRQFVRDLIGGS